MNRGRITDQVDSHRSSGDQEEGAGESEQGGQLGVGVRGMHGRAAKCTHLALELSEGPEEDQARDGLPRATHPKWKRLGRSQKGVLSNVFTTAFGDRTQP